MLNITKQSQIHMRLCTPSKYD